MATPIFRDDLPVLSCSAGEIVRTVLERDRRVLLYGPPGVGKSTLAAQLGSAIIATDRDCWCLSADPGSPAFGIPGAISLGKWQADSWQLVDCVALCTLDAGRFRLPLVAAVRPLLQQSLAGVVLIDGPGVVRGMAGRELLAGLVAAAKVDVVLALTAADRAPPLLDELCALSVELFVVHAAAEAMRPGKRVRDRRRTMQWDAYLANAITQQFDLAKMNLIGTPPPLEVATVWVGRQIALLQDQRTLALAEVQHLDGQHLTALAPYKVTNADTLLMRDVQRNADGLVATAAPFAAEPINYLPPADVVTSYDESTGPRIVARVGAVNVSLVNGVFGDPLLHVRLRHQRRSLLFDLGDGGRLPARIAHQVTDVFISHAHLDHIGGFLWLLRSRIGEFPACRLYGPPGLAMHIEGFLQGILWDRVGERGPCFEVTELHTDHIARYALQAGRSGRQLITQSTTADGVLLDETGFKVRATVLDHHGTPVLAYAFEPDKQINIRKDRLLALGLTPGPWLGELKQSLLNDQTANSIQLPDGSKRTAATLAAELTLVSPGKKLVYATDLADSPANRQRLVKLAQSAHTFFCEAAFSTVDAEQAARHGHLTTRACGEIAEASRVARLIPFHFSRRYANNPQQLYEEIEAVCSSVETPKSMALFETT